VYIWLLGIPTLSEHWIADATDIRAEHLNPIRGTFSRIADQPHQDQQKTKAQ
jgi:hypothetical protein